MLVDETFYYPRTPVSVVAVGDLGEALLVRSLLENLGATVAMHLIGTPEDFLRVIGQGSAAPSHMVLCCHGNENGIVFGDYAGGIDISGLKAGSMLAQVIAERVELPGKVVVSTGCGTGAAEFGAAFMRGRVAAYIAPTATPRMPYFLCISFFTSFCESAQLRLLRTTTRRVAIPNLECSRSLDHHSGVGSWAIAYA